MPDGSQTKSNTLLQEAPRIYGIYVGKPSKRWPGKPSTAIVKSKDRGPLYLDGNGLSGDQQADLKVHGGPEKALHQYPMQHYEYWRSLYPGADVFREPGSLGENLSVPGPDEQTVYIGDVFRIGNALLQVSQGRTPCWKLNLHAGLQELAAKFVRTGRTGWYYRVIESGEISSGDELLLLDRPNPSFSVRRVTQARMSSRTPPQEARAIAHIQGLSPNWRVAFIRKSDPGYIEDASAAWRAPALQE